MNEQWGAGMAGAPDGVSIRLAPDSSTVSVANSSSKTWWIVPDEVRNWYGPPWMTEPVTDWTGAELKPGASLTLQVPKALRRPARAVVMFMDHQVPELGTETPYFLWVEIPAP